jgi:hypothetical protein
LETNGPVNLSNEWIFMETLVRFLIRGVVVSAFAAVGGLFKPTSLAGLFGVPLDDRGSRSG